MRPQGDWAIAKIASQLYLLSVPPANGEELVLNLSSPAFEQRALTQVGADYFDWSADGKTLSWSVGATYRQISLDTLLSNRKVVAEQSAKRYQAEVTIKRDIPEGTIVLRGATAITMQGEQVIDNADILIVGNRISAVGKKGELSIPPGTEIKDVSAKYIVPGCVDAHAHWFDIQ